MAILRVALPVAADQLFDYWLPAGLALQVGQAVIVELGRRRLVGVAIEIAGATELAPERLSPILEVVSDCPPLPDDLCELARFVARYYQEPIGLCFTQMLPPFGERGHMREGGPALADRYRLTAFGRVGSCTKATRRGTLAPALLTALDKPGGAATADLRQLGPRGWRTFLTWRRAGWVEPTAGPATPAPVAPTLNAEQQSAVEAALPQPSTFQASLLQGVTGSGKTEVYLAAAARVMATGRQALLLVPEINLTPQLEQRVSTSLPGIRVAVLHSRLAATERRRHWLAAARGEAQLIIGTRLGVFAPLPALGLIIVDEEHDPSFKQQDGVHYHARDIAVYRARLRDVPVILGSATPSLESYRQAKRGRYPWLRLATRAARGTALPAVSLAPNRAPGRVEGIGPALQAAIAQRLSRREQTLLFVNRRGYAPSLLCVGCGWKAMCPRCAARLVLHRDADSLRCHHCSHFIPIPVACPKCGNRDLLPLGFGTQRLERALGQLYPDARVLRVDRDSTRRKGAFATMRDAIEAGDVDILVGTQMLAKGHDFPRLTLVGVLGADNALYSAEFRATERLFALLEQVSGRAGRGSMPGEVWVQTDFPDHPLYAALVAHDYDRFADALLEERRSLGLPPFAYLALLAAEARSRDAVNTFLAHAVEHGRVLAAALGGRCEIYPAVTPGLARRAGLERAQVLVRSAERRALQDFLPQWRKGLDAIAAHRVRWNLDVDPPSFA